MALARPRHPGCGGLAGGWPARRLRGPVGGQPWGVSARCRSAASHCRPHRGSATHHAGNARCHCPSGGLSMYVAVKGGEAAILNSYQLLARQRRGDVSGPQLSGAQIRPQLKLAVDRVMTEGSVYDPELAALAIKQAAGDLVEAIFLLRAYRATLPRLGTTCPLDTSRMALDRRISATFKDLPGGQVLGPTYDYTQRLLDFKLLAEGTVAPPAAAAAAVPPGPTPRVVDLLNQEGLIETRLVPPGDPAPTDLTREPLRFPANRATRLQNLARGDEGFLLAMAYSTQRGYSHSHPFVGEVRLGTVAVEVVPEELGFAIEIGDIEITECEMVNQFAGSKSQPPQFTRGYGLAFGHSERKAMAMSLVDRALRADELGEPVESPAQMQEFVLGHSDSLEASGFVQHLKLPHYVDFQSELELVRKMRAAAAHPTTPADAAPVDGHFTFAYLDERTKRMIRRAILKAVAIPGYQVPFGSREMPLPYGWGTGGIQVNAANTRRFFERTTSVATTPRTREATLIQTRHRIPETPLAEGQVIVYQVPVPEPMQRLEPRETETRTLHGLAEYGLMHVKLYEDIARYGHIATTYDYPVLVNGRYVMAPSPIPKFDNPKMHMNPALQLFGAGREKRIYAVPPYTSVESLGFEDHPFEVQRWDAACALCGATDSFLDEVITDDQGGRMHVCSDSDYCHERQAQQAETAQVEGGAA